MNHIKPRLGDRRSFSVMPRVPFKDSHGATITECRRKIPDRRLYIIYDERFSEAAVCKWY